VGLSAFVAPKGYETRPHRYAKRCGRDLAQGGGFAEPWVDVIHVVRPEGAIERAFPFFNHNPVQSPRAESIAPTGQIAQKRLTQGSAKPPPWAKSRPQRFA
jgi:hypothetical protein